MYQFIDIPCFNPLPSCEGRLSTEATTTGTELLQSTSLLRGKTRIAILISEISKASIHFPLAREDAWASCCSDTASASIHFPLAREDKLYLLTFLPLKVLQSTSLLRGKTNSSLLPGQNYVASIHFPLAREDVICDCKEVKSWSFNPLPSCEGRLCFCLHTSPLIRASIHFPLAREDANSASETKLLSASIHFPLAREDMRIQNIHFASEWLQSTSLLRGKTISIRPSERLRSCFNPLPSCEGRPDGRGVDELHVAASIHFPLAREDSTPIQ